MQFVDIVKIKLKGGKGGDGAVSFHREKYITAGGPDGGDGGRGGDVIFMVDDNMSTLLEFKYKRKFLAENGANGQGRKCFGKDGKDIIIRVPRGTLVFDNESDGLIADLSSDEPYVICRGGRGGWGNSHFATPTRQAPRFAKPGLPGDEMDVRLELKLLADVGLLGFPNVGKSTFLSMVSAARPKIASYHFTTLVPNLGLVRVNEDFSFVLADIPGIIEGAAEGAGLGHYFLRHVERCRLLVHIVDVSGSEGRNPIDDFNTINSELARYNPALSSLPQIVVGNKIDLITDDTLMQEFKSYIEGKGHEFFAMSAATTLGVAEVKNKIAERISTLPPVKLYIPDYVKPIKIENDTEIFITRIEPDVYTVEGEWIARLMDSINFTDYESRMYFERILRKYDVYTKLEDFGVNDGDTIILYGMEFEYAR